MMKLDNVLAAAFKSMTNDKKKMDKKKRKQILDFKLRFVQLHLDSFLCFLHFYVNYMQNNKGCSTCRGVDGSIC